MKKISFLKFVSLCMPLMGLVACSKEETLNDAWQNSKTGALDISSLPAVNTDLSTQELSCNGDEKLSCVALKSQTVDQKRIWECVLPTAMQTTCKTKIQACSDFSLVHPEEQFSWKAGQVSHLEASVWEKKTGESICFIELSLARQDVPKDPPKQDPPKQDPPGTSDDFTFTCEDYGQPEQKVICEKTNQVLDGTSYPVWKCKAPLGLKLFSGIPCKSSEMDCRLLSPRRALYEGIDSWPEVNKQFDWDVSTYQSETNPKVYVFNKFFTPSSTGKCILDGDIFLKKR